MYYSNSDSAKALVDDWYQQNIFSKYDSYVANGIFCEQAKVKYKDNYTSGNITMAAPKEYKPNFECDVNSLLKNADDTLAKVGLITIDEALHAGGYYGINNTEYYLYNGNYSIWTMSPAGIDSNVSKIWNVTTLAYLVGNDAIIKRSLRPVINLNADVLATGTGDIDDPYKISIN